MEGSRSSPPAEIAPSPSEWEAVVRPGMFVPLQMRKRDDDGNWVYRDPTEAEIQEFIEAEAW